MCCFPLKNLPFSMTSDPSECRRKVDTRWSSPMAAKLERSRLATMAFTKSDQFGCAECCGFFICQWAKSHGIFKNFPTQMTIQVVPSSLEQTEWVDHRLVARLHLGQLEGPQAPKSGSGVSGRAGRLLVKTWHWENDDRSSKLPCCSILCNYMGPGLKMGYSPKLAI